MNFGAEVMRKRKSNTGSHSSDEEEEQGEVVPTTSSTNPTTQPDTLENKYLFSFSSDATVPNDVHCPKSSTLGEICNNNHDKTVKRIPVTILCYLVGIIQQHLLGICTPSGLAKDQDDNDKAVREAIFILAVGGGSCCSNIIYLFAFHYTFQDYTPLILGALYWLFIVSSAVFTYYTKNFMIFCVVELGSLLLFPSLVAYVLGGYYSSGGIILWSILAPLCAYFIRLPQAGLVTQLFIGVSLVSCFIDFGTHYKASPPVPITPTQNLLLAYMTIFCIEFVLMLMMISFSNKLHDEKMRTDELLNNLFPASIVERLKRGETNIVDRIENSSVLFISIANFEDLISHINPAHIHAMLNEISAQFDSLTKRHQVEKIKTNGDSYMAAANISRENVQHVEKVTQLALSMLATSRELSRRFEYPIQFRVGIASGPLVAGVIGLKHRLFDVYGSTVNLASRMETTCPPDAIQVCERTAKVLLGLSQRDETVSNSTKRKKYQLIDQGTKEIKGLGKRRTYLLRSPCD